MLKILLKQGIDINTTTNGELRSSLLILAFEGGHIDTVKLILAQQGLDVNYANKNGDTALMWAAHKGDLEIVEWLINAEADINKCNAKGLSAATLAALHGHTSVLKMLISEQKIDINTTIHESGNSLLILACRSESVETVEFILAQSDVDVNYANKNGDTALIWATYNGHLKMVELLIQARADINKCNADGYSAATLAALHGQTSVLKMLISEQKIDINTTIHESGNSLLILACRSKSVETVEFILAQSDVDVNYANKKGDTALMWATYNGHLKMVELLIQARADINKCNSDGYSAATLAALRGHTSVLTMLILEQKIDINTTNNESGNSLLILACRKGHFSAARIILSQNGVDINHQNKDQKTAKDLVNDIIKKLDNETQKEHYKEILQLLESYKDQDITPNANTQESNVLPLESGVNRDGK